MIKDKFLYDPSLVFYADLPKHDGTSFQSDDAYGHLCTVTGATWGMQGRTFDADDEHIDCASPSTLDDLQQKTIITWFKASGWGESDSGRIIQKAGSVAVNRRGWSTLIQNGGANNRFYHGQSDNTGVLVSWVTPTSSIALNTWYCGAITHDISTFTNNPLMYIGGASKTVTEIAARGGAAVSWESDALSELWIGARDNVGTPDREFQGIIGEVLIYNRVLSAQEILHNYLATKWRYSG